MAKSDVPPNSGHSDRPDRSDQSWHTTRADRSDQSDRSQHSEEPAIDVLRWEKEKEQASKRIRIELKWNFEQTRRRKEYGTRRDINTTSNVTYRDNLYKYIRLSLKKDSKSGVLESRSNKSEPTEIQQSLGGKEQKEQRDEHSTQQDTHTSPIDTDYQELYRRFEQIQHPLDSSFASRSELHQRLREGTTELQDFFYDKARSEAIHLPQQRLGSEIEQLWKQPRKRRLQDLEDLQPRERVKNIDRYNKLVETLSKLDDGRKQYAKLSRDIQDLIKEEEKLEDQTTLLIRHYNLRHEQTSEVFEYNKAQYHASDEKRLEDFVALQEGHITELADFAEDPYPSF